MEVNGVCDIQRSLCCNCTYGDTYDNHIAFALLFDKINKQK